MNAVIPPRDPLAGSVTAITMMKSALRAPLMKIFWPLITHLPFLYSARVFMPAGSEPAPGSVIAIELFFSPFAYGSRYFLI